MFGLGPGEIAIMAVIGVLLFGSSLPKMARQLGSVIPQFKRGIQDVEEEVLETKRATKKALED
jgi:sec-independent protein translocase protein TatA